MKQLYTLLLLLPFLFISCSEEEEKFKRELIIQAYGKLSEGSEYKELSYNKSSSSTFDYDYTVYLYKGIIDVTDEVLSHPLRNCYKYSRGIFFEAIDNGKYTVVIEVYFQRDGVFGTSYYKGTAYSTVDYPSVDLGKQFYFDFSKKGEYTKDDIKYIIK